MREETLPLLKSPEDLERFRAEVLSRRDASAPRVSICSGTGCHAYKSHKVAEELEAELKRRGMDKVVITHMGCHGFCEQGPVVIVFPQEFCYFKVKPEDVAELVETTLIGGAPVERLLYKDAGGEVRATEKDIPFYKLQNRIVFGANRMITPTLVEDYLAIGGYKALAKALTQMTPEGVVSEVKKANLRGRGGGGFPAGLKWEATRKAPEAEKYVIVNADEGDPGAYMDRSLLEGNPQQVIEGLMIAGYAIGAKEGYVYVRQEYPLAVVNIGEVVEKMRRMGLLGQNILGTDFSFDIFVHRGAGAFVSGESSALMSAIEGKVGEPRPKYIRTSISGLRGKPSSLNNVETLANVPLIIEKGADWFRSIGTENSKGTKIFSLVGKVKHTGLVEVPMGITLREIIYDIGGGIRGDKEFKAVQTGGPSGGVLPTEKLDLKVDFDELTAAGSMMGSGGMIVMDEDTCLVDVSKYFLNFLADESCGKCIPCREGIGQLLHVLERITGGEGRADDLDLIQELSETMVDCSLCALGQSAPNPVLSSLKYFRDEYRAHIEDKCCPGGVCKALVAYWIDADKCIGCGKCAKNCPVDAIRGEKKSPHVIDLGLCVQCNGCYTACPSKVRAVTKMTKVEAARLAAAARAPQSGREAP